MESVQRWAQQAGHDYHFAGDEFLALAPDWYRAKAGAEICPVADLARLLLAGQLLARGYDQVIWVDADVLVFRPEDMQLALARGFAFTHEIWTHTDAAGMPTLSHRVNNSLMLFARENVHLAFFVDACLQIAHSKTTLGKFDVGTDFLSRLRHILPFPLIECAGMLSPPLLADISRGESRFLARYGAELSVPLACANLCASLQDQPADGFSTAAALYESAVTTLLQDRGECINRWRKA